MITKYNDFLNENKNVDSILDKISKHGMNSLSKEEKEYLNKFSRGEDQDDKINDVMKGKSFVSDLLHIPHLEFVYDKSEHFGNEIKHFGDLIFGEVVYTGFISCDNKGEFKYAEFFDVIDSNYDDEDLYTKAEGLEQEVDSFFVDEVCPYLI
ncbi:MAG: DUF6576 domain-containing protein [bacterium]